MARGRRRHSAPRRIDRIARTFPVHSPDVSETFFFVEWGGGSRSLEPAFRFPVAFQDLSKDPHADLFETIKATDQRNSKHMPRLFDMMRQLVDSLISDVLRLHSCV